jgi:SAM-dependent methyltransferase
MPFDLDYFEQRWNESYDEGRSSRLSTWDNRAEEWDRKYRKSNNAEQPREARMIDTAGYLRSKGLLGADCDVADVGCGPGRFVAEFAKTARFVLGTDISPKMTEYGAAYCREQGLGNTAFQAVDFKTADIKALGWENRFDLVFTSITPAASGKGLDKIMQMSRAWCFNACFVYSTNDLHNRILSELFGKQPKTEKTSHSQWLYELFNLLWLRGYYPEIRYYKQPRVLPVSADRSSAERLADFLLNEDELNEDSINRIQRFLELNADSTGTVQEASDCWYGWTLWDVRDRHNRTLK